MAIARAWKYDETHQWTDLVTPIHSLPGRLRLRVRGLYNTAPICRSLQVYLSRPEWGVLRARANPYTSTLLIIHTGKVCDSRLMAIVRTWMLKTIAAAVVGASDELTEPNVPEATSVYSPIDLSRPETLGLGRHELDLRRATWGPNELPSPYKRSRSEIFLQQFVSLQVAILAGGAVLAVATGGFADALLIGGVILLNGCIGFYTESKAERVISSLLRIGDSYIDVYREGEMRKVAARELVPGDVALLTRGEVPADVRLLDTRGLTIDESLLTGESEPVLKQGSLKHRDDGQDTAWMSTTIVGGSALAVVTATGRKTKAGEIHESMNPDQRQLTPLQRQLDQLSRQTIITSAQISLAVALVGLLRHMRPGLLFDTAVSLAIAAIPEGLSTVGMIAMARGARRMRRRGIHVRDLQALESLGEVDVLCLDKTGTLTANKMSVQQVRMLGSRLNFPSAKGDRRGDQASLARLARVSALCREDWQPDVSAGVISSTEFAIADLVQRLGHSEKKLRDAYPILQTKHRDESRRYLITSHAIADGGQLKLIKGSPPDVLRKCQWKYIGETLHPLTDTDRARVVADNKEMADEALRVLAMAQKHPRQRSYVYIGLVGMQDPPRPNARALIMAIQRAGIRTILLTGDQENTALALGRMVSLKNPLDVYARVSPTDKLRVIQDLQAAKHVVAMVGDGINDGPALRQADVGIAVGGERNDVAAAAAQIVCETGIDDLIAAFHEGRSMRKNLSKAIQFMLSTNLSELMVTFGSIALTGKSPFTPLMLLWINLLTDVFPALAIANSSSQDDLGRPSSPSREPFTNFAIMTRDALVLTFGILGMYLLSANGPKGSRVQVQAQAFLSLTMNQMIYAQVLAQHGPMKTAWAWANPVAAAGCTSLALALGSCRIPVLARLIGVAPLPMKDLALLLSASLATNQVLSYINQKGGQQ